MGVKFNTHLGEIVHETDSTIKVKVPKRAGNGYLVVYHNGIALEPSPYFTYQWQFTSRRIAGFERGYDDRVNHWNNFDNPCGICVGSIHIYVADTANQRIRKMSSGNAYESIGGNGVQGFYDGWAHLSKFSNPYGIALDNGGSVIVADTYNQRIRKISPRGIVSTIAGTGTQGFSNSLLAKFSNPYGVAVDHSGNIYVADQGNYMIRKIEPDGRVSTFAGSGIRGYNDGPRNTASFAYLFALTVDNESNIYVTDEHRIRRIDQLGNVTTLAGTIEHGFADGFREEAKFYNPMGIAVDHEKYLYIADTYNNRIRRFDSYNGYVMTLAGTGRFGYLDGGQSQQSWLNGDGGNAELSEFSFPTGIAIRDAELYQDRILYVTDPGYCLIRVLEYI